MNIGGDLFSDYFARRDNWLRRVDSRSKLMAVFFCITAVLLSKNPVFPGIVLASTLLGLVVLRVPAGIIAKRYLPLAGLALVVMVPHMFQAGPTALFTVSVAKWHLTATLEGARQGLLIGSRAFGAFGLLLLLTFVTPAYDIFRALRWFRVPKDWLEIAMMSYRYIFVFLEEASEIATAQKIRLGYFGWRRTISSTGVLVGSVIIRSLEQSQRTHEAMTARAYGRDLPFAPMPVLKKTDVMITLAAGLAVFCAYLVCERGLLR